MTHTYLSQEWQTLQQCHEQHERNALHIKLACVALYLLAVGLLVPTGLVAFCIALLWGLEAIFKTYQARIAERILRVEGLMAQPTPALPAMQLHSEWINQRSGVTGLLASYARSALKPTVAFPYVLLLVFASFT